MSRLLTATICIMAASATAVAEEKLSKADARWALQQAVGFFRNEVSASGGYLWRYSEDLTLREGEGKASAQTAWVQPPGTPTVGTAYLEGYELCGDDVLRKAVLQTAHALVKGQLLSGGWDYRIEFHPKQRLKYAYRVAPGNPDGRNVTTFDDNTTQSALRFLMQVDRAFEFKEKAIHEAVEYALESILKAQYPNGAWPQRYSEFPNPAEYPVKKASYPESWSRTWPKTDYRGYYTFNDNSLADLIATMFDAREIYGEEKYAAAAEKAGDFIILAQMPEPQPGWAQQYNVEMHPAWARKFEPASVTGGESRGVIRTLMFLYQKTGKEKFLEPIPRALEFYKQSELPGNKMARFYELQTNRPLYFTKQYELTYSSDDMPTHYGFIVSAWATATEAQFRRLSREEPKPTARPTKRTIRMTPALTARAKSVIDQMDKRGAWIQQGTLRSYKDDDAPTRIIETQTFTKNILTLSQFLAAE